MLAAAALAAALARRAAPESAAFSSRWPLPTTLRFLAADAATAPATADPPAPSSSSRPTPRRKDAQSLAAWRRGGGALPALAKPAVKKGSGRVVDGAAAAEEAAARADASARAARAAADARSDPVHPFLARAHYVGPDAADAGLKRMRSAAARAGLPLVWDEPGSAAFCLSTGDAATAAAAAAAASTSSALPATARYVAVFAPMGSVVFFNGGGYEKALWRALAGGELVAPPAESAEGEGGRPPASLTPRLKAVARGRDRVAKAAAAAAPPSTHTDDVRVYVAPRLPTPQRLGPDALTLRAARAAVVKTVACVAAQTVALA
jgi:hypothetical protein